MTNSLCVSISINSMAISILLAILLPLALLSAAESPSISTAPPQSLREKQLSNIIDALIGAGDFAGWANLLSFADPSVLPITATFFIPTNDAISRLPSGNVTGIPFDPFLVPYHIVPQRLTFSELRQFTARTRLPTLLPSKFIIITDNSPSNFSIDDSRITQADIFVNAAFSVHGIQNVLDYSVYGGGSLLPPKPSRPEPVLGPREPVFPGGSTVGLRSGASSLCSEMLTFCVGFVFTIISFSDECK